MESIYWKNIDVTGSPITGCNEELFENRHVSYWRHIRKETKASIPHSSILDNLSSSRHLSICLKFRQLVRMVELNDSVDYTGVRQIVEQNRALLPAANKNGHLAAFVCTVCSPRSRKSSLETLQTLKPSGSSSTTRKQLKLPLTNQRWSSILRLPWTALLVLAIKHSREWAQKTN